MAAVNPDIFKRYDVRGIYGQDFDVSFAEEFGNKIARALKAETLVIGRDSRLSSDGLEKALVQGVLHAGTHVFEIGECTTPTLYFAVGEKRSAGGIMITASHNPGEYNGFKVVGPNGSIIGGEELGSIYATTPLDRSGSGKIEAYDAAAAYADKVAKVGGALEDTFTVGVQASKAHMKIMDKVGAKAALLIQPRNSAGLEVVFDADADRISFYDRKQKIDADFIALLIAQHRGYKKIAHDFRCSRAVREQLKSHGIISIPSRVGRLNVYENMKNYDADFGFELSGHFYLKDFNYLESPETVLLWIREIIHKEGKNLTELTKPFDKYFRSGELSYPLNPHAVEILEDKYSDAGVSKDDGLLIEYDEWWCSLRPSQTEPLMRLIIEANSETLLHRKLGEIKEALHLQ